MNQTTHIFSDTTRNFKKKFSTYFHIIFHITGVKKTHDIIEYSAELKKIGAIFIPSDILKRECQIRFENHVADNDSNFIYKIGKLNVVTTVSTRILACSNGDSGDTMGYLCEWWNNPTKYFVSNTLAKAKFPNLVNDFLEQRININEHTTPENARCKCIYLLFYLLH